MLADQLSDEKFELAQSIPAIALTIRSGWHTIFLSYFGFHVFST